MTILFLILQAAEATEAVSKLFEYNISLGILAAFVVAQFYYISKLFKDRDNIRTAWLKVVSAREAQVEAKDKQIAEMSERELAMMEKVTSALTKVEVVMDNAIKKL